jgi:cytochrome c oxidase subunit 2
MLNLLGLPVAASEHAGEVDRLIVLVHWLMAVLFAGWGAFLVFVLVRFRKKANPRASYAGTSGSFSRVVEVAVVVIEAVLLIFYAIPVWATRVAGSPPTGEATIVRVVAEQYAWNVHYPGADGQFGRTSIGFITSSNPLGLDRTDPAAADDVATINQLVLPEGRPVLVHLSSKDVIHSFSIPEMRVKHDAIPGLDAPVWFIPIRRGEYEIVCSQLCGLAHYRMRSAVSVKTMAEFQAFLAEEIRAQAR